MTEQEGKDGFLARWSRRKQAVAAGEEIADEIPGETAGRIDPVGEAKIDEEQAAELEANRLAAEAVDIDALEYESDFSVFFKEGVPALLRQKALRILWRSNPILANVDGLCDYDDNFADPSLIMKTFDSAYRAGKGYLFDDEEKESKTDETAAQSPEESGEEAMEANRAEPSCKENSEETAAADTAQDASFDGAATDDEAQGAPGEARVTTSSAEEEKPGLAPLPEVRRARISLRERLQFDA